MSIERSIFAFAAALLLTVSAPTSGMAETQEVETDRGARLLLPLKMNLKQALMAGMQQGPVHAIKACKDQAPEITNALACHGSNLAPDVAEQIRTMYPQDAATGFELDDLRGVYWVEYPAAE